MAKIICAEFQDAPSNFFHEIACLCVERYGFYAKLFSLFMAKTEFQIVPYDKYKIRIS